MYLIHLFLSVIYKNKIFIVLFLILSPIYISLDFSNGLKFDAFAGNMYSKPSVPISLFIILILGLCNVKRILIDKKISIFLIFIALYIIVNLYYGTNRAFIVGCGMLIPLVSFCIFKSYFMYKTNVYAFIFFTIFSIICIKFLTDVIHIYFYDFTQSMIIATNGLEHAKYKFNTVIYLIPQIKIYSYYDYFPFLYYLAIVLSFNNIINKKLIKSFIFFTIIVNIAVIFTASRLFIYGIYLIPILYVFYKITSFKLTTYFYLSMFVSILITLIIGFINFNINDISIGTRNLLAYNYLSTFKFFNILFPFINEHRLQTQGSFHNEFLEIFSFFGLLVIYYYYLIKKIFCDVNEKYKIISFFLMFIIVIGGLIQLNISNPCVGIILGMVLAICSKDLRKDARR